MGFTPLRSEKTELWKRVSVINSREIGAWLTVELTAMRSVLLLAAFAFGIGTIVVVGSTTVVTATTTSGAVAIEGSLLRRCLLIVVLIGL